MTPQFCKVGKIKPSEYLEYNLNKLEEDYLKFMDEAYSLMHADTGISDFLYYEASQLKKKILTLRKFI